MERQQIYNQTSKKFSVNALQKRAKWTYALPPPPLQSNPSHLIFKLFFVLYHVSMQGNGTRAVGGSNDMAIPSWGGERAKQTRSSTQKVQDEKTYRVRKPIIWILCGIFATPSIMGCIDLVPFDSREHPIEGKTDLLVRTPVFFMHLIASIMFVF